MSTEPRANVEFLIDNIRYRCLRPHLLTSIGISGRGRRCISRPQLGHDAGSSAEGDGVFLGPYSATRFEPGPVLPACVSRILQSMAGSDAAGQVDARPLEHVRHGPCRLLDDCRVETAATVAKRAIAPSP